MVVALWTAGERMAVVRLFVKALPHEYVLVMTAIVHGLFGVVYTGYCVVAEGTLESGGRLKDTGGHQKFLGS